MTARLATLVLAACSFGCLSEQPIASGSPEPVDPSLLGNWRCLFADEADPSTLTITEVEGRGVRAVFSGGDSKPSTFTGYAVKFEGKRLLNVRSEDEESRKWTLAQYTMYRPTVLYVEYPHYDNKAFNDATTSAQKRDALRRGYKAKTLFQDSFTCVRIMDGEAPK